MSTTSRTPARNNQAAQALSSVTWVWDASKQLYYSPESGTYAYTDQNTGQWHYIPASSVASSSTSGVKHQPIADRTGDKEDGEIEDDVGWGGLMEPEQLDRALRTKSHGSSDAANTHAPTYSARYGEGEKHPAYGATSSRGRTPTPPPKEKETPNDLLRLVVLSSPSLTPGHIAIVDTREGGVQIGRDRCEKGGHARIRVKEMEVSKTHAVVYWGQGGEADKEGWWVVDLGSTHGTFVSIRPAAPGGDGEDLDGEPLDGNDGQSSNHRLSSPKTSSLPHALAHLDVLSLGQTRFEVHAHESWPCETCQLGRGNEIVIDTGEPSELNGSANSSSTTGRGGGGYAMTSQERRDNREVTRKREMAALKDSLLNRSAGQVKEGVHDGQNRYLDRSALRRQMHPRSPPPRRAPPPPQTEAEAQPALPGSRSVIAAQASPAVSSFAQNMLAAQGWAPGSGLGRDQAGRSEAIEVKMRVEKRGLGAQGAERPRPATDEDANEDWRKRGKVRRFDEMRSR